MKGRRRACLSSATLRHGEAYRERFGQPGSIFDAMMDHLDGMAKDSAMFAAARANPQSVPPLYRKMPMTSASPRSRAMPRSMTPRPSQRP